MSRKPFTMGDRVIVAPDFARPAHRGVVYRVTRALPVNVVVEPVAGGRPMRINPPTSYQPPTTPPHLPPPPPAASPSACPTCRSRNRWSRAPWSPSPAPAGHNHPSSCTWSCATGDGRASIVKLGGDNGRYWRGVRRTLITVIDPARITLAPADGPAG